MVEGVALDLPLSLSLSLAPPSLPQISDGKIEFFPLLQALCLELEEDETAHQLEALRAMVHTVLERFKEEVRGGVVRGGKGGGRE